MFNKAVNGDVETAQLLPDMGVQDNDFGPSRKRKPVSNRNKN
jgi:hypothetical protein